jgi:hypothetical protein
MRKPSRPLIIVLALAFLVAAAILFASYWPTGKAMAPPAGFTPLRDDALAARYCPEFVSEPAFGPIIAVYYRAARDAEGTLHIAYHPAWAREVNKGRGFGPFLSRTVYTGGLSLQRAIFGKGDIESIAIAVDGAGQVVRVEYETAKDYDPAAFSVTHAALSEGGPFDLPLRFRVVSWNHLFARMSAGDPVPPSDLVWSAGAATTGRANPTGQAAPLAWFSPALWKEWAMWKNPETVIRKDRAHFAWERGVPTP